MKGHIVPAKKLAALPFALAIFALSACSFEAGDLDSASESSEEASESTSEAAPSEESSEPAADDAGLEINGEKLATAAEDALEEQLGTRPDIDCTDLNITIFEGRQHYCTLLDAATGDEYEVTLSVTSIEGEMFNFDIVVADTPK